MGDCDHQWCIAWLRAGKCGGTSRTTCAVSTHRRGSLAHEAVAPPTGLAHEGGVSSSLVCLERDRGWRSPEATLLRPHLPYCTRSAGCVRSHWRLCRCVSRSGLPPTAAGVDVIRPRRRRTVHPVRNNAQRPVPMGRGGEM